MPGKFVPAYETRKAIDRLVKNRGAKAEKMWFEMFRSISFYASDPYVWAANIRDSIPFIRNELKGEAKQLFDDIVNLLRNPPLP